MVTGTQDNRMRNFACVLYEESCAKNKTEIITEWHIPAFLSPYHDKDINPTGEPKKPHWHLLLMFEGKKSEEQVKQYFDQIGGVGIEKVGSLRGYARYLCHLDNPEKYQYSPEDVNQFAGADYLNIIGLPSDKYKMIAEMMDYIRQENIIAYADLTDYAKEFRFDWFRILCDSGTIVIKEYIKSRKWLQDEVIKKRAYLGSSELLPRRLSKEEWQELNKWCDDHDITPKDDKAPD